jgi:hypothetical protein
LHWLGEGKDDVDGSPNHFKIALRNEGKKVLNSLVESLELTNTGPLLNNMDLLAFSLPTEFSPTVNYRAMSAISTWMSEL